MNLSYATLPILAVILLATGCATTPGGARLTRYRPTVGRRSTHLWEQRLEQETIGNNDGPATGRPLKYGDKIVIFLRGIPDSEEITDVVDEGGTVSLPHLNDIVIAGKTTSEAEAMIEKAYVDGEIYSSITIIVVAQEGEYFVQGEVKKEGRYPLSGDQTLLRAIATAGGYTDFARTTKIEILRGETVLNFDIRKIEQGKRKDPLIEPGDIIRVKKRWM